MAPRTQRQEAGRKALPLNYDTYAKRLAASWLERLVRAKHVKYDWELFKCLEECQTICICTTNLRDRMDPAAMRRFSHKLNFTHSGPEQLRILYDSILSRFAQGRLGEMEESRLFALQRLTPGDFAVVRNQLALAGGKTTHDSIISALAREQNLKLENTAGHIGFTRLVSRHDSRQIAAHMAY